jgi:hypothetical protein
MMQNFDNKVKLFFRNVKQLIEKADTIHIFLEQ